MLDDMPEFVRRHASEPLRATVAHPGEIGDRRNRSVAVAPS